MSKLELYANNEAKPPVNGNMPSRRFMNMCDLHQRYIDIRDKHGKREEWANLNLMYQRWEYVRSDGNADPNFGQFRFKVDKEIGAFEKILTERDRWCQIHTYEGKDDAENAKWSKAISDNFYEFCIKPWRKRFDNIRMDVFDMVMYGKGIEFWEDPDGAWSENIPVASVLPDKNATMNPEDFDLLFIKKLYTVGELYSISVDPMAEKHGWNIQALRDLIDHADEQLAGKGQSAYEMMSRGELGPDTQDMSIELVFGYVKEYSKDKDDKRISMYVFPETGDIIPRKDATKKNEEGRYLREMPYFSKCFTNIIALRSNMTTRSFYNMTSFAEQIYVSCRFYDTAMIKMIRSVIRNMILYIKSDTSDAQDRLSNITDDEVQVLDPGDTIEQVRTSTEVGDLFQVLRQVMFDTDSSMGAKLATGSQNVKGRAVTAKEAEIQNQNAAQESSTDVAMFMIGEDRFINELYRRFIKEATDGNEENKWLKKFKRKMESMAIPTEAYDPDNVLVVPFYNPNAASPDGRIRAAEITLNALSRNPQSDGEARAIKEIIAGANGWSNVNFYVEEREFVNREALIAGLENESMSNPDVFEKNVMVLVDQSHVIHMTMHLADAAHVIEIIQQKFEYYDSNIEEAKPVILHDIAGLIMSLDLKLSHMEAHIMMFQRSEVVDKRVPQFISAWRSQMQQIRLKEQAYINKLSKEMQERIAQNREDLDMTLKQQHMQEMYRIEEEHAKNMSDIKLAGSVDKASHNLAAGDAKRKQDMEKKSMDQAAAQKAHEDSINQNRESSAVDLASKRRQAEIKLAENELKLKEKEQKSKETNTDE